MTTRQDWLLLPKLRRILVVLWFQIVLLRVCCCSSIHAEILSVEKYELPPVLTNALQIEQESVGAQNPIITCSVRLEGTVLWVNTNRDQFILQDDSGGVVIRSDPGHAPPLEAGQRIIVEGNYLISHGRIVSSLLINNDGIHFTTEQNGSIFLTAGLHAVKVQWFNGPADYSLRLDWAGPGITRQPVPDQALFRDAKKPIGSTADLLSGLDYTSYEGVWDRLPDFSLLPALKNGVVSNFDLAVRPRDTNVALVFSGYLLAPRTGTYDFWLRSDDGSKLFFGDERLHVSVVGFGALPQPKRIFADESRTRQQEYEWSEVEGVVTRVNKIHGSVSVELTSGARQAYLEVINGNYDSFWPLLHSRVKALGISQSARTIDGQLVPSLLVPDFSDLSITEIAPTHWVDSPVRSIQSLKETNITCVAGTVIHVAGTARYDPGAAFPIIEDSSGRILVEISQPNPPTGSEIEAIGWWDSSHKEPILQGALYREMPQANDNKTNHLPLLTEAIQVKSLNRKEAKRGYPVDIQGVVSARVGNDFVIQDSTWSVFCYWYVYGPDALPEVGDYWEIKGESAVDFAPDIIVHHATYLGRGVLPEPIHPSQDDLINGSLDTQYIEVQGIVTGGDTNEVTLLTSGGRISVQFDGVSPPSANRIENALVRLRGVCSPNRDTNQMILHGLAPLRLFNTSITVDEPAPSRPFEIPLKHVSDLLFFDARADALRRVRIVGQILGEHQGEYFLSDHGNGLRFDPKTPTELPPGTLVEVVGFPDLTGPSPVLREALVHINGKKNLPAPRDLTTQNLFSDKLDATRVSLKSRLIGLSFDRSEWVLELQTGTHNYVARLASNGRALSAIQPGSLLGLTGIYASSDGYRNSDNDLGLFELLLDSPADISVLAKPPWWNFRHTLTVIISLTFIILAAMVWISLLRRQVEERTQQWTFEIKGREQAERQRALEAERARIAQDLHDDLGATLTEIRFLGAVKSRDAHISEVTRKQLKEISEKSRQLVSSLDEIVWAVNPANDSLLSLATYLRHVAEEFFRTVEIRYRLEVDQSLPSVTLTSEVRHNVYLVVREALNNVAKHSRATESWLRIHWKECSLHITVEDNGCGFVDSEAARMRNGLFNMRRRLEKIGGQFTFETHVGSGTVCRIYLPLK